MEDVRIKVTPETLQAKAGTVDGLIEKMTGQYEDLFRHVRSLSGYWKGEAADKCMKQCESDYRMVSEMMCRLREYPADLREMAGIYTEAEKAAVEISSPLPADVIL